MIIVGGSGRFQIANGTNELQLVFDTQNLSEMRQDSPALSFSSGNAGVATVDEFGVVTRVGPGRVVMTCSATRGTHTHTETPELVFYGDSTDFLTSIDVIPV